MITFDRVVAVGFDEPQTGEETLNELMKGPVNYQAFQRKCRELSSNLAEHFLVSAIVNFTLTWAHQYADDSRRDEVAENHRRLIDQVEKKLDNSPDDRERASLEGMRKLSQPKLASLDEDFRQAQRRYEGFCDNVVLDLIRLSENRLLNPPGLG